MLAEYTFVFNGNDAQLILDALSKLPYFQVKDLIYNIHLQVSKQTTVTEITAHTPADTKSE